MKFEDKILNSFGIQLIVTGLAHLVEEEEYTPHEAITELRNIGKNTFHALIEIKEEGESHDN